MLKLSTNGKKILAFDKLFQDAQNAVKAFIYPTFMSLKIVSTGYK